MTLRLKQAQAVVAYKGKILLLRKRDWVLEKGNWVRTNRVFWRLPKGKLEKGETAVEGLRRELHEEIGIRKMAIIAKVFSYEYEAPKGTHRTVQAFLVEAGEKPHMTRDGRLEGIEAIAFATPKQALEKLHWQSEKNCLKAAAVKLEFSKALKAG